MIDAGLGSRAFGIGLGILLLAGCGVAQSGTGALPTSGTETAQASGRGASWMLPEAKKDDLVYFSTLGPKVYVYSYPALKQVGTLRGFNFTVNECTDKAGDVYITDQVSGSTSHVYEFAHGGTSPIRTLDVAAPLACAVDGKTGNLAVMNNDQVLVYQNAQGAPTTYTLSALSLSDVTYDDSGNLFVVGTTHQFALLELPYNGDSFEQIQVNGSIAVNGSVQWDGQYLAVEDGRNIKNGQHLHKQMLLDRIQVSEGSANIVGTTPVAFEGQPEWPQFAIHGRSVILPSDFRNTFIEVWTYPGGKRTRRVGADHGRLWGTAVSVAPK